MTPESWFVLGLVLVAVILFATETLAIDIVAILIMSILMVTGVLTPEEGLAGFSHTATVTVGAMFVLSAALYKTGALNFFGLALGRIGKYSFWIALTLMMAMIAGLSMFINNTAVVAIFLPIVLGVARETGTSPSKLLMPVSFASIFGGVCTLIGTSTNILVGSITEQHGEPPFRMFEFAPLGLVLLAAGMLYMLLIGVRLIPARRTGEGLTENYGMGDYLTEVVILPASKSEGVAVGDSPLVQEFDLDILTLIRNGTPIRVTMHTILQAGDELRLRTSVDKIKKLQAQQGILLKPNRVLADPDLETSETILVEAVIAPNSMLEGKSLKEIRFRNTFGATTLALRHREEVMHEMLGNTPLHGGDVLLIEVMRHRLEQLRRHRAFIIVSEVGLPEFRAGKILPAVLITAGVVIVAAIGLYPIVITAIAGCILLVLTRCISPDEAYRAIDWKIIFLLAGVLALGTAMEKTGAALQISEIFIHVMGFLGPVALVSAIYLLTSALTETMSNNATAALLAPIAIATAEGLHLNPRPFVMAVAFAASASFMTPVGYQTNTMVYGPGQYKFRDFLRVGTPLNILLWLLSTLLIPLFWPF